MELPNVPFFQAWTVHPQCTHGHTGRSSWNEVEATRVAAHGWPWSRSPSSLRTRRPATPPGRAQPRPHPTSRSNRLPLRWRHRSSASPRHRAGRATGAVPNGGGYGHVDSAGGFFAFNAPFYGSTGSIRLNRPITGMAAAPNGTGYTMVAADGGLFRFGANSPFYGSAVGACPGAPAVAVAMSPGAIGYWIAFADGRTYAFSPSSSAPQCSPSTSSRAGLMAADLFARVNDERAARHLAPVAWDPTLANYAAAWSANMASHGFR